MKKSLLVAALLAIALSACGKKEDPATTLPAPAVAPSLPTAAESAPVEQAKPAEGASLNAIPEQKPAESKPAN